jgi:hypothetical protein
MKTPSSVRKLTLLLLAALAGGIVGFVLGGRRTALANPSPTTQGNPSARATIESTGKTQDATTFENKTNEGYRLTLDNPQNSRRLSERDARLIQWFRDNNEADYERLFTSLGLDPGQRRSLMEHITKIYQAKIEARKHTSQLMMAQSEFDERMKLLLREKYPDYVAYEQRKPIREESGFLADHLDKAGAALTDAQRQALEKLLEQNEAFSSKTKGSLGGPRGNVPEQAYGTEAIAALERDQAALLREATAAGLTADQVTALKSYYRSELENYERILTAASYPTAKDIEAVERQIQSLKARGNTTPELSKLESQLNWMRKTEKMRSPRP